MTAEPLLVHPLTGIVLDDLSADELREIEARVDRFLRSFRTHYAFRDALRTGIAEREGRYPMPRPSRRTDVQRRVGLCPRCGDALPEPT